MLKIKNNVDLKQLEKFGLKKAIEKSLLNTEIKGYKCLLEEGAVFIDNRSRNIDLLCNYFGDVNYEDFADVLFDLIQAGFVEKVEE